MKYLALLLVIALVSAGNNNKNGNKNNGNKNKGNKNKGNGGPVDSCDKQSDCLNTKITQIGEYEYEICIWWDSSLNNCGKGKMESISHVCYGEKESEKKEGCGSGEKNKICRKVPCDKYASFGLKDGSDCQPNEDGSYIRGYGFSDIEGIICKSGTKGGMCGGGAKKDCVWMVPAPECENTLIPTTTDSPDGPGTTDEPGTTDDKLDTTTNTPDEPCIRDTDINDDCLIPTEMNECEGFMEDAVDGCTWVDGFCTRRCAYYTVIDCDNQCGCMFVEGDCMETEILDSASNARMRIDEYVIDDEYDAVGDDGANENDGRWINGVNNMYLFIGIGVIGFLFIVIIGLICFKVMKKKRYVEMEDVQEQELEMNEIEVDGVQSMVFTR